MTTHQAGRLDLITNRCKPIGVVFGVEKVVHETLQKLQDVVALREPRLRYSHVPQF